VFQGDKQGFKGSVFTIIETPTEIAPAKTIQCNICGATKDITDWDLA
jgi:hypothetical protein